MSKLRIGFVGVGTMGQAAHLRNYATLPDCDVAAIAEMRPILAKTVAARYGVPRVYESHEQMLAEQKLDGIVAAQPFTRHGQLVPQLLAAGVPVFIEKPLASSMDAARTILDAATRAGTFVMVGYHKRCDPATIAAREHIGRLQRSGEIGPLRYVRILMPAGDWVASGICDLVTTDEPMPPLPHDAPAADLDPASNDKYIAFVNYYIHQVNLMRHLLGEAWRVTHTDPAGVLLVGRSDSGVTCTIEMSPYRTTVDWEESALIAFERGYLKLDLPAPLALNRPGKLEIFIDPGPGVTPTRTSPSLPWVHAMRQQAIAFCRAIRGEAPPPCDAAEAMLDLQLAREYLRLRDTL